MAVTITVAPEKQKGFAKKFFMHLSTQLSLKAVGLMSEGVKFDVQQHALSVTHPNGLKELYTIPGSSTLAVNDALSMAEHGSLVMAMQKVLESVSWTLKSGKGTKKIEDAQFETGPKATPYVPTTTKDPLTHDKPTVEWDDEGKPVLKPAISMSAPNAQIHAEKAAEVLLGMDLGVKHESTAAPSVIVPGAKNAMEAVLQLMKGFSKVDSDEMLKKWKGAFPIAFSEDVMKDSGTVHGHLTSEPAVQSIPKNPVPLKDAVALGQSVRGTSSGSVYRVAALGERAKMAVRLKVEALSVRVEGALNATEKAALQEMGFGHGTATGGQDYWSSHFPLNGVPAERVLGVLFFHPKLKFTKHIQAMEEVSGGV